MSHKVIDGFSPALSRQRRYQLRKLAKGLCATCRKPKLPDSIYCEEHWNYQVQYRQKQKVVTTAINVGTNGCVDSERHETG